MKAALKSTAGHALQMRWSAAALAIAVFSFGCAPVHQPDSNRTVAAVEIALRTPADRTDLISMLRRNAALYGAHVDDVSGRWQQFGRDAKDLPPVAQKTIYVGVWRGPEDKDLEVAVDDGGHQGRAWVTFLKGEQPPLSTKLRVALLQEIAHRWPDARPLPVLPSGGIPLESDLILTPAGYKVTSSAASRYDLPPNSPIVAADTR